MANPGAPRLRKPRGRYHHGDLREALVATALRIVAEEGVGALTLRDLARRLGVSHAAPAHHFPDRAALLVALAGEGFVRLRAALAKAAAFAGRERGARLVAVGRAYVAFALDDPGAFRVMWGPHLTEIPRPPAAVAGAAEGGYRVLEEAVVDLVGAGDPRVGPLAFAAWSLLHGACTLFLDGLLQRQLPELVKRATFETWVERAVGALAAGGLARRGAG